MGQPRVRTPDLLPSYHQSLSPGPRLQEGRSGRQGEERPTGGRDTFESSGPSSESDPRGPTPLDFRPLDVNPRTANVEPVYFYQVLFRLLKINDELQKPQNFRTRNVRFMFSGPDTHVGVLGQKGERSRRRRDSPQTPTSRTSPGAMSSRRPRAR